MFIRKLVESKINDEIVSKIPIEFYRMIENIICGKDGVQILVRNGFIFQIGSYHWKLKMLNVDIFEVENIYDNIEDMKILNKESFIFGIKYLHDFFLDKLNE